MGGLIASTFSIGLLVEIVALFVLVVADLDAVLVFVWANVVNEDNTSRAIKRDIVVGKVAGVVGFRHRARTYFSLTWDLRRLLTGIIWRASAPDFCGEG